jgi:hypothetical protein
MDELSKKRAASSRRYERFGEIIRHLTIDELHQFFDCIDNYTHKLMFEAIYELGCRVGEFVRIQVKHLNFSRSTVFFPAENTKTKHARISYLPRGLTNEIKSMLKQKGLMSKRWDTAGQLGIWNHKYCRLEPITWVAPAGQLIYRANSLGKLDYAIPASHELVGSVPNSDFPVHVKIADIITHNTAIIGVTGSGKSYLAFHLIVLRNVIYVL